MLMLALLAGAIGCTKDDDVAPAPSSTSTPAPSTGSSGSTTGTSTVDKTTMLRLVNEARKKGWSCGATYMPPVDTVVWNSKLEQAALLHSQDMNKNSYFDHTGLDGSTPATRITAVGYTWQAVGENIARGYTSEKAVVDAWLASEGHCKNIMNKLFTEMGVARDGNYWTQEFGKPLK